MVGKVRLADQVCRHLDTAGLIALQHVRQAPSQLNGAMRRGFKGIPDIGELRELAADSLLHRAGRRPRRCQGQPAQQRPQPLPVISALGERRAQRRPGLLSQSAQPLGGMKTGYPRAQAIIQLVTNDLAGLRLQIDQASRPGQGTSPGENALMRFPPPRFGQRAASKAIGQLPECRPVPIRLRVPEH